MTDPDLEYHLVYREGPEAPVERRGYQQVHLPRLAVFSTCEEGRLYIQMVAILDKHTYGRGKNGLYCAHALPFDLTPVGFEDYYSWFAAPLRYDGEGQEGFRFSHPYHGFETRAELKVSESLSAGRTPEFTGGDLVLLRGWDYRPDSYAVVTTIGTSDGFVQKLEGTDVWSGWYSFVFMTESGFLDSDYAHVAWNFQMLSVAEVLPSEYRILELLSRHYKGESPIPCDLYLRLTEGLVLVEDMDVFPFGFFEEIANAPCIPYRPEERISIESTINTPTEVPDVASISENMRPELRTAFVVFALEMHYNLGVASVEAFDLCGSPAVFSSFAYAQDWLSYYCVQSKDEDSGPGWERMCQCFGDRLSLDVDPGLNFAYNTRVQIVELLMPCETITDEDLVQSMAFDERVTHTWCYNVDGTLLWESPAPDVSNFERYAFEGRYKVGDLVYVVPQGIDPESESITGEVGVVSAVPISKEAWLASGEDPASWYPFYTVDFVDGNYYLQHFHVPESSLLLVGFPVREDQAFLPFWSKYLRGDLTFPEGLADRIRARTVLLRKCPRYDFDTGCIVD